jgi:hypothetical protein
VVIGLLILERRFRLRSNFVYFACLSAIFMSTSPVIQPRYFFGVYVVLCVEAARRWRRPRPIARAMVRVPSNRGGPPVTATA